MILRQPQPELLDSLPPDHPEAQHSRRDLVLINRFMGNHRWFVRALPQLLKRGERVLELGAGNGELSVRLAACGIAVDGLDLRPQPEGWPAASTWHQADLTRFLGYGDYPVIVGNLILHHFPDETLAALGMQWRRHARLIVACEPARRRSSQILFRMVGPLFNANRITLNDAQISIAAGFRATELAQLLGLESIEWECFHTITLSGAYHFVARRRS